MNPSSPPARGLLRLHVMTVLVTVLGLSRVCCVAQVPALDPVDTIDAAPSQNPWEQLPDIPGNLGRFVLACDEQRIYQLGGISFNIRGGQRYGHHFAAYDPSEQTWEKLPSVPHGTGGAQMAMWPATKSLVMISGIKKLGDRFSSHGLTIGIYPMAEKRWATEVVRCRGLGRVAAMIHLNDDRFLLVAGDDDLNAHRTAILEMEPENQEGSRPLSEKPVVTIVGEFPKGGRILGIAGTGETVSVLQDNGREPTRMLRFSAANGAYTDSVDLSTRCEWTDKLFAWQGNLLIWKNDDPSRPQSYQHASQLLLIEPATGRCKPLHPHHPGPIARRSSDGIVFDNCFYVFGGQRDNETFLKDAHRYKFRLDVASESPTTSRTRNR